MMAVSTGEPIVFTFNTGSTGLALRGYLDDLPCARFCDPD